MTLFVNASALVAIIRDEPGASDLLMTLNAEQARLTSGLALWEAALAVARLAERGIEAALAEVERLCGLLNIIAVPIGGIEGIEAVHAHARYGKGTGHPARLNMGDCFTYACARTNGARLLYKGNDFVHTDLA